MEFFEEFRTKANNMDDEIDLMRKCFEHFDEDRDSRLNGKEFKTLVRALFCNSKGEPYKVDENVATTLYSSFCKDTNVGIGFEEFRNIWTKYIRIILHPVCALIIVDIQNDFVSGSLAIRNGEAGQDGAEAIPIINRQLDTVHFEMVVYTLDWHPENHISFIDNIEKWKLHPNTPKDVKDIRAFETVVFEGRDGIPVEQTLWPKHCVQDSWGAQIHSDLKIVDGAIFIKKGCDPDVDCYSGFMDNMKRSKTKLAEELRKRNVTDVFICGLAYDICVAATTMDAIEAGFRTAIIDDGCRGVSESCIANTQKKVQAAGGVIVSSDIVSDMVEGRDRRPELGYYLAKRLDAA